MKIYGLRKTVRVLWNTALLLAVSFLISIVMTNHVSAQSASVLIEGNCFLSEGQTTVTPGTCGDYDGDGRAGTAEDTDGDRIFGTVASALGANGINRNGTITIVTSGYFEGVILSGTNKGNITLEAARGVNAIFDASAVPRIRLRGSNYELPGIIVGETAGDNLRSVVLRNLTVRNYRIGIRVSTSSSTTVQIEDCRIEHSLQRGLEITGNARATIIDSYIYGTGQRDPLFTDVVGQETPATPGNGIEFSSAATGTVANLTIRGNTGAAIANRTNNANAVRAYNITAANNNVNFDNVRVSSQPCGSNVKPARPTLYRDMK